MMSSVGGVKSQNIGLDTDEYDFYDPHWFSERSSSLSNKVKKEQTTPEKRRHTYSGNHLRSVSNYLPTQNRPTSHTRWYIDNMDRTDN